MWRSESFQVLVKEYTSPRKKKIKILLSKTIVKLWVFTLWLWKSCVQLILKIYEYNFALNDLSLYLDLNPDDKNVYSLFKKYTEEQRACVELYEKKYGPLELDDSDYSSYMWYKEPWPFVGGNV